MQRWKAETNRKLFRKIFTHAFSSTKTMIFSDQDLSTGYHKNHALRKEKIKYNILARVLLYTPVTYHKKIGSIAVGHAVSGVRGNIHATTRPFDKCSL